MTLSEKLRLIAKGFSKERVTTTQARSAAPYISHAAELIDRLMADIERLQVAADASRHYAMHYLQDERDEPDLCHDSQHHADVVAVWDALDGLPFNGQA